MFNPDDDAKPQAISHAVITIDPNDLGDSASYSDFEKMSQQIIESGGRVPGAKRVHPKSIEALEINLSDAVAADLNDWSTKLGIATRI